MENLDIIVAKNLLKIKAVFLKPNDPFTWASGIKSPIYCDNRLTLSYVDTRKGAKDHGRGNQIEGVVPVGKNVVVIEDLISTAGSSIEVVNILREAGCNVLGIASIFTYNLKKGITRLQEANVENHSLSNFEVLAKVAAENNYIEEKDLAKVLKFQSNPSDPSWMDE